MHSWIRNLARLLAALALPLAACSWPQEKRSGNEGAQGAKPSGAVRVLVVDDAPLAEIVARELQSRSEVEFEVSRAAASEIVGRKKLNADAIIFPTGLLGDLVERGLLAELPRDVLDDPGFARPDILPLSRQHEVSWGSKVYAVPFGSPQLVVLYRADICEKLGLAPPKTWAEYQSLAEKLADRGALGELAPAGEAPWHGACEPLGPEWAGQTLLARAAGYARNPDQYSALFDVQSMRPLIAGPPFVRALEELVAAARLFPPEARAYSPHDARREFLAGRCGLALTWPTAARAEDDAPPEANQAISAGIAELPGAPEYYHLSESKWNARGAEDEGRVPLTSAAGRLGSVTTESRRAKTAFEILTSLSGRAWNAQLAAKSRETTLYRTSHAEEAAAWVDAALGPEAAREYVRAVEQANGRRIWLASPRIPGRDRYLAALDSAVQAAVSGEQEPAQALAQTAREWESITAELGLEKQRRAYQRSLGLDP